MEKVLKFVLFGTDEAKSCHLITLVRYEMTIHWRQPEKGIFRNFMHNLSEHTPRFWGNKFIEIIFKSLKCPLMVYFTKLNILI